MSQNPSENPQVSDDAVPEEDQDNQRIVRQPVNRRRFLRAGLAVTGTGLTLFGGILAARNENQEEVIFDRSRIRMVNQLPTQGLRRENTAPVTVTQRPPIHQAATAVPTETPEPTVLTSEQFEHLRSDSTYIPVRKQLMLAGDLGMYNNGDPASIEQKVHPVRFELKDFKPENWKKLYEIKNMFLSKAAEFNKDNPDYKGNIKLQLKKGQRIEWQFADSPVLPNGKHNADGNGRINKTYPREGKHELTEDTAVEVDGVCFDTVTREVQFRLNNMYVGGGKADQTGTTGVAFLKLPIDEAYELMKEAKKGRVTGMFLRSYLAKVLNASNVIKRASEKMNGASGEQVSLLESAGFEGGVDDLEKNGYAFAPPDEDDSDPNDAASRLFRIGMGSCAGATAIRYAIRGAFEDAKIKLKEIAYKHSKLPYRPATSKIVAEEAVDTTILYNPHSKGASIDYRANVPEGVTLQIKATEGFRYQEAKDTDEKEYNNVVLVFIETDVTESKTLETSNASF